MMELTIHREDGFWVAHLEKALATPETYPLMPDNKSLYLVIKALKAVYPQYAVYVDHRISDNPFMSTALFASKYYHHAPDYERIQYSLEHPEVKVCGICKHKAWYNCYSNYYWHVGWWECSNPRCKAHESLDGSWFKLSRNAK